MTPPSVFKYYLSPRTKLLLNICLENTDYSWIYDDICSDIPLVQIAQKYLDLCEDSNKSLGPTNRGCVFSAYISYMNNVDICYDNAKFIFENREMLVMKNDDQDSSYIDLCVKDLIFLLDGNFFYHWLRSIVH